MQLRGFDDIDDTTIKKLEGLGTDIDSAVAAVKCDLLQSGKYGEAFLVALKNGICAYGTDDSFFYINYQDFDEIEAESYVSSGSVVAYTGQREAVLSSFTLSCAAKIDAFLSVVRKLKSGKAIEESDFVLTSQVKDAYINNGRKKLFLRVLGYMPKYKRELFTIIALIISATLVNMISPYLTGHILYDEVLSPNGKYYTMIFPLVALLVSVSALTVVIGIFQGRVGAEISGKIIYDIKTEVFEAMQKLGMSFFSSKRTGNLMNRVNNDALDIQYFLNDGMPQFIINALTIFSVGLVLFVRNPVLSTAVLIPVPLIAYILKKSSRKFKKLKWYSWRRSSSLNSFINDSLMGIRVIKAFGREKSETERFEHSSNRLYESRFREGVAAAKVFPLMNLIMTLGGLVVWGLGGAQVLGGRLSFGELMTFSGYLMLLYGPVNSMVKTVDWWTSCMNSAQRIFEVTDCKTDITESAAPVNMKKIRGEVELKNVTFSYEPNRDVLRNVSFKVGAGEMIGLVGHSGAGKSTITNLITRLYDVKSGAVLIDGVNVKDIRMEELHSNIGMVLQETFLFDGTVAENISYAKPTASDDEIIAAAKNANAHDFISNLPDGYDTVIGSHGVSLSGGEKQRLSIARALLMNPAILILDEATSSLDTETESQIQQALDLLIKNRTTIAIAHRLSTLKNAARLVVVEQGEIVESGTHEELMQIKGGVYAKLAQMQIDALRVRTANEGEEYL